MRLGLDVQSLFNEQDSPRPRHVYLNTRTFFQSQEFLFLQVMNRIALLQPQAKQIKRMREWQAETLIYETRIFDL